MTFKYHEVVTETVWLMRLEVAEVEACSREAQELLLLMEMWFSNFFPLQGSEQQWLFVPYMANAATVICEAVHLVSLPTNTKGTPTVKAAGCLWLQWTNKILHGKSCCGYLMSHSLELQCHSV